VSLEPDPYQLAAIFGLIRFGTIGNQKEPDFNGTRYGGSSSCFRREGNCALTSKIEHAEATLAFFGRKNAGKAR
jgi:hypothetical protein